MALRAYLQDYLQKAQSEGLRLDIKGSTTWKGLCCNFSGWLVTGTFDRNNIGRQDRFAVEMIDELRRRIMKKGKEYVPSIYFRDEKTRRRFAAMMIDYLDPAKKRSYTLYSY